MWPDRVSNPGPLTYTSQVPYRLRYDAQLEIRPTWGEFLAGPRSAVGSEE